MQIPQALPLRRSWFSTDDASALTRAQPERGRDYVQTAPGHFRAELRENSNRRIAFLSERWSCGLRVRCARPRSYVAFSVLRSDTPARWCGASLPPSTALEMDRDWELATGGPLTSWSFAVERSALDRAEALLAGGFAPSALGGNRLHPVAAEVAAGLRARVEAGLRADLLLPEASRAFEAELVELATRLRGRAPAARPDAPARRRWAVRCVEEFLDAHERELPSLAELCGLAGVSARTLEYAFREHTGLSPGRYLRVRRLNRVRAALHSAEPGARVTEVAMRWGFWELGRFACDYRALFGERPSATLAAAQNRASTCPGERLGSL